MAWKMVLPMSVVACEVVGQPLEGDFEESFGQTIVIPDESAYRGRDPVSSRS